MNFWARACIEYRLAGPENLSSGQEPVYRQRPVFACAHELPRKQDVGDPHNLIQYKFMAASRPAESRPAYSALR